MYSPKIREDLIPRLHQLGQKRKMPMTHLVAEAVEQYLDTHERPAETLPMQRHGGAAKQIV